MAISRYEAEKFSGKNDFGLWRLKMRAMLVQQGLAEALKADPGEKGEEADPKEAAKKAEQAERAHSAIILNLGDKVLREVAKETTAAGVWAKLESLYMTKSLANRLYMKQRLYSYRIVEERGISEQIEEFNKAIDDLENIDVKMGDEDKAIILLNALPRAFDQLKDAMLYGRENTISLEEVQSALKCKELQRQNLKNGAHDQQAESLNVKSFKGKKFSKKKDGTQKFQDHHGKSAVDSKEKETRSCHYCKKPGHLKKNCFSWKKKLAEEEKEQHSSDCVEGIEIPHIMNIMDRDDRSSWIVDSGCTFHLCPVKDWFEELTEMNGSVLLGNNQTCRIQGIGKIRLRLADGSVSILTEVRYIPEIKRNIISLGMLEAKGCSTSSSGGMMRIAKNGVTIMTAARRNNLYYLVAQVISESLNAVQSADIKQWHSRLGHLSEGGIKELMKKGLISLSNDQEKLQLCEECVLSKSKKLPYPKGQHCSTAPLDYAHADLWGPASPSTIGGGRYFLSIIDDFSRKLWVYVLREKSDAFKNFKLWHTEVETEKGSSLKYLRTDNGLEFLSHEFENYCRSKGIRRHKTVPSNPQQNGVAERMNRTILERVRCMLFSSGMPKSFWGEAVATAAKLINKSPSAAIEYETPDSKWYGRKGDYSKLKPFGCMAYAHVRQSKLEPRALRCAMLGYQQGVKGFRLWCFESGKQKVIVSRDVIFEEDKMPFLEKQKQKVDVGSNSNENTGFQVELEDVGPGTENDNDLSHQEEQEITSAPDVTSAGSEGLDAGSSSSAANDGYQLARDRVRRIPKPSTKYNEAEYVLYALCVAENIEYSEPANYRAAVLSKERVQWLIAMRDEIDSLMRNGTWILVDAPAGQKAITCKWVFKKKVETTPEGTKIRFKARLVARGFNQQEGVDYNEVFSPVVKHSSIRILLSVVNQFEWELQQLDVKTVFLHGDLEERIYMHQPEGFVDKRQSQKVCLLRKSIYGLKQSSRQWYKKFDQNMERIGFSRCLYDNCVYVRGKGTDAVTYLLLYVDDMLLAGPKRSEVEKVKLELKKAFEMKDLGDAKRILGMDIVRDRKKRLLWLHQQDYIGRVIKKFQMDKGKETSTPMPQNIKLSKDQCPKNAEEEKEMSVIPYANIVGSIMYTMVCTRPDVAHAISVASRYMSYPGRDHWLALKWILRYLKGSGQYGILYRAKKSEKGDALIGYCDSDFAANLDNRKSQTGYVFNLFGSAVSWKSTLQPVVALSTTEAEYMALTEAIKESYWLKGMVEEFGVKQECVNVLCDSNSAICLTMHQVFHERTKHIDVKLHFIRDEIEKGGVKVVKVSTEENAADMLTKPLPVSKFKYCLELVNLCRQ